jgi:Mg2+ and Co2+ transporter CorA
MAPGGLRLFRIDDTCTELDGLPDALPAQGFVWIGCSRSAFEVSAAVLQSRLHQWGCGTLVDLHISDLLNLQLPSHFDYTSWYDLLVFRRLAAAQTGSGTDTAPLDPQAIDTSPVGFAVFDRVLLTVHPDDCAVREFFAQRLLTLPAGGNGAARIPTSPADLMLRIVNHMVDGYLALRRLLTRQLGTLQHELLGPRSRRVDWHALLDARNMLHQLEDLCEDQRSAVQEWIDALAEWPDTPDTTAQRERELLGVRSRDVLEHIERVLGHVRRLESSIESAVQMHFSAVGQRTNDIMRTLTVLTAIFLPLNLVTGIFGMNFDALPLIHNATGFWIALGLMLLLGGGLGAFFWRKRYLGTTRR